MAKSLEKGPPAQRRPKTKKKRKNKNSKGLDEEEEASIEALTQRIRDYLGKVYKFLSIKKNPQLHAFRRAIASRHWQESRTREKLDSIGKVLQHKRKSQATAHYINFGAGYVVPTGEVLARLAAGQDIVRAEQAEPTGKRQRTA